MPYLSTGKKNFEETGNGKNRLGKREPVVFRRIKMKNKGFILIYVLIFLALSFLVITGLIYNQKLDNGLRRSEDKGMKDY